MRATMNKGSSMGRVVSNGLTDRFIKDNLRKIELKVLELMNGLMAEFTKGNGKIIE